MELSLKLGYPQIMQVMDDHFSIETNGDLGIPHF